MASTRRRRLIGCIGYVIGVYFILQISLYIRGFQTERELGSCFTKHYSYFVDKLPPLKIFLYNLSLPYQNKVANQQYVHAIPHNYAHTTVFEYIVAKTIEYYKYRVFDPENADLFYVPLFGAIFNQHREKADIDTVILPQLREFGPYFDRSDGVDHAWTQMLFSHDNIPITPYHQHHLPSMITLGDLDFNYSKTHLRESWRNNNFPLTSNINQLDTLDSDNTRPITAFFIGQIELSGFDDIGAPIRRGMANELHRIPHAVVINAKRYDPIHSVYSYNFSRMMASSEYCLVPHGDGPTTKRLFDTFKTLCIPIVLSDQIRFPFENLFIDYSKVLIQIPAFHPEDIGIAMSLPDKKRRIELRANMLRLSEILGQKFNYKPEHGDLMWAWLWVHYFKLTTIAASKRRGLLVSPYL